VLKANVKRYQIPLFYSNIVGAQTEIIFDGGSVVFSPDGQVYDEMPYFKEEIRYYQTEDVLKGGFQREQAKEKFVLIHDAIVPRPQRLFWKTGFEKSYRWFKWWN
jgi:NAD+ synthase (glutamine-hydrolysing)